MRAPVGPGGPTTEELPIGRVFGPYKILSTIQRGGMGELFLAERTDKRSPNNKVVLKRLLSDYLEDERYVRMFRAEAKIMSSLDHPNIVKVFDLPMIDGKQCLAMEYVQGRNLAQILRRCRELNTAIPPLVAIHVMTEVLRGLDYAHHFVLDDGRPLGLVHRDVTPGNILVSFDGAVKITDFGIAKSEMSSVSTTVGVVKGTTRYLAPEQIRGQPATPRSDCFSAAVVLTEALTGHALFDHGTVPPTLFAIVTGQRSRVSDLLPFQAPRLASALERVLDLNPERRFRTARELADALEEAARDLGRPMDKSGLSIFLKELFRGAEQPHDEEDLGAWHLDPMDLTYLFEVQEVHAFKPEPAKSSVDRSQELERVKALLKAAVPGANPLDANQFAPRQSSLVTGLNSPSALRSVPREETRLDRPKSPTVQTLEPFSDTADVFSDATETVDDAIVERPGTEDSLDIIRIDPASNPEAHVELPEQKKPASRGWRSGIAFVAGLVLGALGWSQVDRVEALFVAPPPQESRAEEEPARKEQGQPRVVYPALHHRLATAHEGVRRGARPPRPEVLPPALLTIKRPAGARVRLNGVWLKELTPVVQRPIEPGEVQIELVKRKVRKRYRVEAKPGESIDL